MLFYFQICTLLNDLGYFFPCMLLVTSKTKILKIVFLRLETEQNAYIKRMEESTKAFDIDLLQIVAKKKELSVNLKYAELTILSMYEELQIVRATEETEDDLKLKVKELQKAVTDADQLVSFFIMRSSLKFI